MHAVSVNQLLDTCNLGNFLSVIDVVVACPTNRLERNLQVAEDCVVEVVAAEQVVLNQLQELTGTCTLNDAVVVGAGQGDDLDRPCWVMSRTDRGTQPGTPAHPHR